MINFSFLVHFGFTALWHNVVMKKLPLSLLVALFATFDASAGSLVVDFENSTLGAHCGATFHSFTTVAKDFDCSVDVNPDTLTVLSARCSFKFDALDSEETKRDRKMGEWMDSETYPTAEFVLTEVQPGENPGEQIASGTFTMHGQTHPIQVPFTVTRESDQILIDGTATLDYREWGLKKIRMFVLTVDPEVEPYFHLEGTLAEGADVDHSSSEI